MNDNIILHNILQFFFLIHILLSPPTCWQGRIGQVKKSRFLVPTNPTKLGTFSTGGLRKSQWFSNKKENVSEVTLLTTGGIIV